MKIESATHKLVTNKTGRAKRPRNVPNRHARKVHAVGSFKGHMKMARGFWNQLDRMTTNNNMPSSLSKQMGNPSKLTASEERDLLERGIDVEKGYVI